MIHNFIEWSNFLWFAGAVKTGLTQPVSCQRCSTPMNVGEMAVFALRAGPYMCWHVHCFVCSEDGELLVDHVSLIRKSSSKSNIYPEKTSYVAMKQVLIVWTYQQLLFDVRAFPSRHRLQAEQNPPWTVDLWKPKLFLFRFSERTVTKHTAGWWFGIIFPID